MVVNSKVYKHHSILTKSGEQKGIFFRSPIQKVEFDAYYYTDDPHISAWIYMEKIKNPIRRFYEILIGNKKIVDHIEEWSKLIEWGGFEANVLMSPIYFTRIFRSLECVSRIKNDTIRKVVSYGYEAPYNYCSGACYIEKTKIILGDGKRIRIKRKKSYNYTYSHIVERMIDTGNIDE